MTKDNFYHPKFLPMWVLIVFMWLGAKLPFRIQVILGSGIGKLLYLILIRLKTIAFINMSLCFPEKNSTQIKKLNKQHFRAIGIAIFDTANAFFASDAKIKNIITVNNEHHFIDEINKKQRIVLLTSHFMPLMLSSRALSIKYTIANIYRPQNNKLFDKIMCSGLSANGAIMIKSKNTKSIIKTINSKIPIWYAPDQDLGIKNSVFAPFFNIQTATASTTARLAKITNSKIIPYFFIRTKNGYEMSFFEPIKDYPSDNAVNDATKTNKVLQNQILKAPEQYLWIHKRFKTRQKGEPNIYNNI